MTMLKGLTSMSISTQQRKQSYFHRTPMSAVCIYVYCSFGRLPSIDYRSPVCRLKLQQSFNRRPPLKKSRLILPQTAYLQIIFSSLATHRTPLEQPAYTQTTSLTTTT
ncbi:hypothetical protein ElyMa_001466400 [Elysia marginata]|uniref:Uncharacterized protein n=1 Tax=Elysia marginata TaxID=1093978 RepID=A0AAV4J1A5_9GAST|nr:hypothetical protein ElyMa_001466400 [Elysia marginata]